MPSSADCYLLQAIMEGVEAARAEASAIWGAERLPLLVDDVTRARIHSQTAKWSRAIQSAWDAENCTRPQLDEVEAAAAAMKRMYLEKLPELASEAGHRPLSLRVFEHTLDDGTILAVTPTNDDAAAVIASGRAVNVYTMTEVAAVIAALPEALRIAKVTFPGAKVNLPEKPINWKHGDEIPFGEVA